MRALLYKDESMVIITHFLRELTSALCDIIAPLQHHEGKFLSGYVMSWAASRKACPRLNLNANETYHITSCNQRIFTLHLCVEMTMRRVQFGHM